MLYFTPVRCGTVQGFSNGHTNILFAILSLQAVLEFLNYFWLSRVWLFQSLTLSVYGKFSITV